MIIQGKPLRVRLPLDYPLSDGPALQREEHDGKTVTVEDFTILRKAALRFAALRVAEDAMRQNLLRDILDMGYVPHKPTRRERLAAFGHRARDAWRVLTGEAQVCDD